MLASFCEKKTRLGFKAIKELIGIWQQQQKSFCFNGEAILDLDKKKGPSRRFLYLPLSVLLIPAISLDRSRAIEDFPFHAKFEAFFCLSSPSSLSSFCAREQGSPKKSFSPNAPGRSDNLRLDPNFYPHGTRYFLSLSYAKIFFFFQERERKRKE